MNNVCEHIIGLYSYVDYQDLITVAGLKKAIQDNIEFNELCDKEGYEFLKCKAWRLSDYIDFRKSVNLVRFRFCPYCGEQIKWKQL